MAPFALVMLARHLASYQVMAVNSLQDLTDDEAEDLYSVTAAVVIQLFVVDHEGDNDDHYMLATMDRELAGLACEVARQAWHSNRGTNEPRES